MECGNCNKVITSNGSRLAKAGVTAKLKRQHETPVEVIKNNFAIDITPKKCPVLCNECCSILLRLNTSTKCGTAAKESFKSASSSVSYVAKKLRETSTPCPKRRKLHRPCKKMYNVFPQNVSIIFNNVQVYNLQVKLSKNSN